MKKLSEFKTRMVESNIPEAMRHADEYVRSKGGDPKHVAWSIVWSQEYHKKMDELCKADGVRV